MTRYGEMVAPKNPEVTEKARVDQAENNTGGFVFVLDVWARLDRFLVLGCDQGTYYVGAKALTKDNFAVIEQCIALDGPRTVARIVEISDSGRAPKNDPAIFALAVCCGAKDQGTRKLALDALRKVCRTGTHLFHFVADVEKFRKWGRGLRRAVAGWYTNRSPKSLARQVVKYQQRDGWANRDLLRLSHAVAPTPEHDAIFRWVVGGTEHLDERLIARREHDRKEIKRTDTYKSVALPEYIVAFEALKRASDVKEVVQLIESYDFTHETIPTQWKNHKEVWEALLAKMPLTAMIRNLGKMTSVGVIAPFSTGSKRVVQAFGDTDRLHKERVHPMTVLVALKQYATGHGDKGSLSWSPVPMVVDALDSAFYAAFKSVEPTGKNTLVALDVSGSMGGTPCIGAPMRACEATAAISLLVAKTEPSHHIVGFADTIRDLGISSKDRLDSAMQKVVRQNFGATDCSLAMAWAHKEKLPVETFIIMTDNETNSGLHPYKTLLQYRQLTGINAKLVVYAVSATQYTIADPRDPGMLDICGFDAAGPQIAADFARDKIPVRKSEDLDD